MPRQTHAAHMLGARAGTQVRRGYHAGPAEIDTLTPPDPSTPHAAGAPGRQGGSRFLAKRLKPRATRRGGHTARDGETGRPAAPSPAHCPDAPPNQTYSPWGALFFLTPRASPLGTHPPLTRASPARPEPPRPFFPALGFLPAGSHGGLAFLNTPCAAPQELAPQGPRLRRRGGCGRRRGKAESERPSPLRPPPSGSQRLQGQPRRAEGDGDHVSAVWLWGLHAVAGARVERAFQPGRRAHAWVRTPTETSGLPRPLGGLSHELAPGEAEEMGARCDSSEDSEARPLPSEAAYATSLFLGCVTCHLSASVSHSVMGKNYATTCQHCSESKVK